MKLYSMGYTYIVDKKNANTINWKCDHCKGRATSWNEARIGARSNPRVEITRPHTHAPNLAIRRALIHIRVFFSFVSELVEKGWLSKYNY